MTATPVSSGAVRSGNLIYSNVRERRVLAYIEAEGASAMQLCAERGLTSTSFKGITERAIWDCAEALHARQLLFPGHSLAEEVTLNRKVVPMPDYLDAMSEALKLGSMSYELPILCREMRKLETARKIYNGAINVAEALKNGDEDKARAAVMDITTHDIESKPRASWAQTSKIVQEQTKNIIDGKEDPDVRSIPWPWRYMDVAFKPFRRGENVVIGGFVSLGKSSLLRQLALNAARQGHNVAIVSMEVPQSDMFNLMAAAYSGQSWSRLKNLHPTDQKEFLRGCNDVGTLSISCLDDATSLASILGWLRMEHNKRFLDVIAIDYLGLIDECDPVKGKTKAQAVGEVANVFKKLARELDCVVFVAVQINRGPMNDNNREPQLKDLKDSGDVEAHADRVLLLYRPDHDKASDTPQSVHDSIEDRPRYFMQLFQEKGRNAGTANAALWMKRELARFELIAK